MKIRDIVFGSKSEQKVFKDLNSKWTDKYGLSPQMPFTSIIDIEDANITQKERDFLYKTSVDFTLYEKVSGKPILSIDFDGMGHGFSHDSQYIKQSNIVNVKEPDPYRKLKFDLKLRISREVLYNYIIISYEEAELLHEDMNLTMLDGIIGQFIARENLDKLLKERTYEITDIIQYDYDGDFVQNWFTGLEVEADLESNPIVRNAAVIMEELSEKGIHYSMRFKPDIIESDIPKVGYEITFIMVEPPKEISSRVEIRDFGLGFSLTLAEYIATLLAAKKTLEWWLSEGKNG